MPWLPRRCSTCARYPSARRDRPSSLEWKRTSSGAARSACASTAPGMAETFGPGLSIQEPSAAVLDMGGVHRVAMPVDVDPGGIGAQLDDVLLDRVEHVEKTASPVPSSTETR